MADGTQALGFTPELVVDLFAGAGGASDGIADAYRAPDVAINHNPIAIAVHRANHPRTQHYIADVFEVCPIEATRGQPVGILWASPDCRHHSKAKGGKPRSRRVRGLAWVVVRWAYQTRPRMIFMENVEEFRHWGPLDDQDMPIKAYRGRTFEAFCAVMSTGLPADHPDMPEILDAIGAHVPLSVLERGLGYSTGFRELVAANYKTPTIRKRLYGVMRCDGRPIVWPEAEAFRDAREASRRWRMAAECIDFSDLGRSIFDRKKPLANASQRRIARGCWRHVLSAARPFIVPLRGTSNSHSAEHGVDAPLSTVTAGATHQGLVAPVMVQAAHGEGRPGGVQRWGIGSTSVEQPISTITASGCGGQAVSCLELAPYLTEFANASNQRTFQVDEPLRTQVAQVKGGHFAMVAAHLVTNTSGHSGAALDAPVRTLATGGHHALVGANLMTIGYGEREGQDARAQSVEAPLGTVVGSPKHALVAAHLTHLTHHGDRSGLPCDEPMRTVTGAHRGEIALVGAELASATTLCAPHVVKFRHDSAGSHAAAPMPTITAGGDMARPAGAAHALGIACAFLEQANAGPNNGTKAGRSVRDPFSTVVGSGSQQQLVAAYLVRYCAESGRPPVSEAAANAVPPACRTGQVQVVQVPAHLLPPELMQKARRCAQFLRRWLPEHFGDAADLVLVGDHVLVDITLRMLQPPELKRANGFREDYILDRGLFVNPETGGEEWRPITKTDQVKLIGNSVCRQVATALVRANAGDLIALYQRIAA